MASSIFIGYLAGAKVSFDGTSITWANPLLLPDGTASAPALAFSSDSDTGWRWISSGRVGLSLNGTGSVDISSTTFAIADTMTFGWGDTVLSRAAANRLRLASGDVCNLAPTAFASLPTGAEGDLACVTDSNTATWGATIAGGGANNVIAFFNGTNWTVMGA